MSNRIFKFRAWDGENMQYDFIIARPQFADCLSIMTDEKFAIENYNSIREWKVMQFTGLSDVTGKEIWEGDIVNCYDGSDLGNIGVIGYSVNCFSLKAKNDIYIDQWNNAENIYVLGNIYENPELLKNG